MRASAKILSEDLAALRQAIAEKAKLHKTTPMIGRSHGVHAEPITFGLKLALMFDEFGRSQERLAQATERVRVGKLSGAVGSAMPNNGSPITSERRSGLARVVRGNALAALENVALWHERDISHSSAERIILPDSCTLLDYMLVKLREVVSGLHVYPQNMRRNL